MNASITVRELSRPTLTMVMYQSRDERATASAANVSGCTIELVVKRDLEDADSLALFTLAATIVDGPTGVISFAFDEGHTGYAPGSYPCEIHWWEAGAALDEAPQDALSGTFTIEPAVAPR